MPQIAVYRQRPSGWLNGNSLLSGKITGNAIGFAGGADFSWKIDR
jgi:hypothetical protein